MRTALGVLAICAVAALAVYVFQRPTFARGAVFEEVFLANHADAKTVTCDEKYEIGVDGGTFHCAVVMKDGESGPISVRQDRAGTYHWKPITSAHSEHSVAPASADPWE